MSTVHVTKIESGCSNAFSSLLSRLNLPEHAENISIKLNLCDYRNAETGATSDPYIVKGLLTILRSKYPKSNISLVENDASGVSADNIFSYLGFDKIAEEYDCDIVNLAHDTWVKKKIDGLHFEKVSVPATLEKSDLFITHPKLKTHGITKITCSLKNQFGCAKPKAKVCFHKFIDDIIVDVNLARKPDFSIVDANICMEGLGGPTYGRPKKLGLLIGGSDIVAVDSFCARLMGFNPSSVTHIKKAAAKGLGNMNYVLEGDSSVMTTNSKFSFNYPLYFILKILRKKLS